MALWTFWKGFCIYPLDLVLGRSLVEHARLLCGGGSENDSLVSKHGTFFGNLHCLPNFHYSTFFPTAENSDLDLSDYMKILATQ